MSDDSRRWAVMLAGGEGTRMQAFLQVRLGERRPKQYCAFAGGRATIEETARRALALAAPERIVSVIGPGHGRYLESPRRLEVPGRRLEEPQPRGTGCGLLLALADVLARDPEAVVAVLPADHFVDPPERFGALLREAYDLAEFLPGQLVLLAARPESPSPDYGWILPLRPLGRGDALRGWMGTAMEAEAFSLAYRDLKPVDLSRDILERSAARSVALPMRDVEWSDRGRPERILDTARRRSGAVGLHDIAVT
jgi:hypothetical protein